MRPQLQGQLVGQAKEIHSWMQLVTDLQLHCVKGHAVSILKRFKHGSAGVQPPQVAYLQLLVAVYELWQLLICSR